MANYNMSFTKKKVAELGLIVQLIPSNNPLTCSKIIAGTQVFKVANKTNSEIEAILLALKEGCKTISSDTRADINTGNIEKLINLNQSINKVFQEYMQVIQDNTTNTVGTWQDMLINFYCYDDEGHELDNLNKVTEIMNKQLNNKEVVIYNNYIFNREGVNELVKKWIKFNKIENIKPEAVTNRFLEFIS